MSKRRPNPLNDWRKYLTPSEASIVAQAEAARDAWQTLKPARSRIVNEACKRRNAEEGARHG